MTQRVYHITRGSKKLNVKEAPGFDIRVGDTITGISTLADDRFASPIFAYKHCYDAPSSMSTGENRGL